MTDLRTARTDVIGSLLRPAYLKDARKAFDEGKMPAEEFHAIEDKAVRQSVRMQEDAGVAVLTDLGSAVLTVKALLAEGDELPEGTRLVDAPFVEGAVAAVVTASTGAGLDAVEAAAGEAYTYRKV